MALLTLPPDIQGRYWRPITDAQYTACYSLAQMLMFGGAAGPGKTSFIVADAVREFDNPNLRGLVLRESGPQLEKSVMPKMRDVYTQMGAYYVAGVKRYWTFPSGAKIFVGVIAKPDDIANFQGGEYCVERGTPILMGDGSYRPIEAIEVGDLVQTLEGPKPVTHTWHGMHKPCVEAHVWDASGHYVGSQVHPETHPVLGASSWESYASLASDRSGCGASNDALQVAGPPVGLFSPVRLFEPELLSDHTPVLTQSGTGLAYAPSPDGVETPSPTDCMLDVSDSTTQRSHPFCESWYTHPYTNERRPASWASSVGACQMRPVGMREVCDLTVADANHYITASSLLINRNSYIGIDESTYHPENHLRDLLPWWRTTDPSLFKRIRLATNPGGDGAPWHMHTFLRNRCPYHFPKECVEAGAVYKGSTWLSDNKKIPFTVSFIPGLHTDHTMHGEDYAELLRTQAGDRAEQLLKGCWCSLQGAYFKGMRPDQVMDYILVGEKWWWHHYIGIDYGYGNSAAAAGLYCVSPPTPAWPRGRHFKIDEIVLRETLSDDFARAVCGRFAVPIGGQPRRIQCAYIDPANNKHDGTGRSNMEIMNETFMRYDIPLVPASNDPLGGSQQLARMLASGELVLTDMCPHTFRSLATRMHDPKRPGCYTKVRGAAEDDIADETRYAVNTWSEESVQPRNEEIQDKLAEMQKSGLDQHSLMIHSWRLEHETPKEDAPATLGRRHNMPIIRR